MDPQAFGLFKWDLAAVPPAPTAYSAGTRGGGLENLFQGYDVRNFTAAKIAELGFTANTLVEMKDEELDYMMSSLSHIFRWDLLVGERYGIKAAVRAERRRLLLLCHDTHSGLDALSQEGLSEAVVRQDIERVASGGGVGKWVATGGKKQRHKKKVIDHDDDDHDEENKEVDEHGDVEVGQRQREHPFIVTEPGEVARGKKNGLDYLFHLYEQCRDFLIQVQNIAKDRGEKCPTKVTNQVFRYAKKTGASYINKPKMRHYVHCYALHCLDEEASNSLRRVFKERGENVGAWRQACYEPLVTISSHRDWDIDAIFNSHPRLSIWYVPTKLRHLCHTQRTASSSSVSDRLPF